MEEEEEELDILQLLKKQVKAQEIAIVTKRAQVEQLWPQIIKNNNEIFFVYKPFNWTNNAKDKAGVTCSIIGIRKISNNPKYIFDKSLKLKVNKINGYLTQSDDIYITKKNVSISKYQVS